MLTSSGRSVALFGGCVLMAAGWVGRVASAAPPAGPAPAAPPAKAAAPAPAADPVRDPLDKAKAKRTADRAAAKAALVQAIDAQIKTAGSAGDLDALKALTTQKDAFAATGVLPNLPALKDATALYTQALRKADGEMVAAYEAAIGAYTGSSRAAEALALRKERQALLEGTADVPADSPEAVALLLDRAKADYLRTTGDAKKALVDAIDARAGAATKAGDLNAVTKLEAVKAAAEADAAFPDDFKDAAVLSARARYGAAVQSANARLAQAYRDAVRNFTRARAVPQAQAAQAEFEATGLAAGTPAGGAGGAGGAGAAPAAAPGASGDTTAKLGKILPAFLSATGAVDVEKDGIRTAGKVEVVSKTADYLGKDFVFDVWVTVPKGDQGAAVGIGDTTEKGSIRVMIRNDGGWGRRAFLGGKEGGGSKMGAVKNGEQYVVRLERHGGPITASVGSVTDGKFTAEHSQTISDPKAFCPGLSEKRASLYFHGSMVFNQVRLATGTAAAAAGGGAGEARSPLAPVKFPAPGAGPAKAPGT